ncbi:hypothetical protein [Streptantibioticus silvisoli]|uniref:Uncharacterized protein n=1 Tax=Streptantibioticus silvisoli TaxID=2705255 RepID=A0ABT6W4L7_9ACTN|nr:hypothetical protein [Streptantibioticus silvisoli]MDI5965699.1 hypothetical protein [Streptantibioticus silvisoli]
MRIKQIELDDEGMPEAVLVRMTHDEALYLALLTGKQTGATSAQIIPGGAARNSEVYEALTGELFNRYYDDGVNDAVRAQRESA